MFEKLIELVVQFWSVVAPCVVVSDWERAAVLRWGRFNRSLEPGYHWKWPVCEMAIEVNTCITTLRLPPQTLTTKDDVSVVVAAIIKYQIADVRPYVTEIWDQHDVLADVTMGAIRNAVLDINYDELIDGAPEEKVLTAVRKEVNRYGFKVHKVTFTDLGKVKSLRLIQQVARDIDN